MTDSEIIATVLLHPSEWHVCRCGKCELAFAADGETSIVAEKLISALAHTIKTMTDMNAVRVRWETIGGEEFSGSVAELDGNVVIVDCDDGKRRAVELDAVRVEIPKRLRER